MPQNDDLDLDLAQDSRQTGRPFGPDDPAAERGRRVVLIVAAVVLVIAALGGWYWWSSQPAETPAAQTDAGPATEAPVTAPAPVDRLGEGEAIDLPPLNEMDPTARSLVGALSTRPELANLLASDDLVRKFVVSVDRISRGASPTGQVGSLRPAQQFSVERPNARSTVTGASFARYDNAVGMLLSMEPEALARVYGQLRPRFDEAYAELGVPDSTFDAAVERAIVHLLQVSPEHARGTVEPVKGTVYAWSDPGVENLSSAQKNLLRLGPTHAAAVQAHLRRVAEALGIPAERLPRR